MEVMARIRYRQPLEKATLYQFEEGFFIEFENPQSALQKDNLQRGMLAKNYWEVSDFLEN